LVGKRPGEAREAIMNQLRPTQLIEHLRQTLLGQGQDPEAWIEDFGQVAASERRLRGEEFGLAEHVRGVVLAQLSQQRSWGPIARDMSAIEELFHDFDPEFLRDADAGELDAGLRTLRCGNRAVRKQLAALAPNIEVLERIDREHGSLDRFVESDTPDRIAKRLSRTASPYKLRQIGFTLALEYLRNVGIQAGKPDVHVRRILGGGRLGYAAGLPSEEEAYRIIDELAARAGRSATYLDNLLWILCAEDCGDVFGAKPRCHVCSLAASCHVGSVLEPSQGRLAG